ncbi:MAG: hypothetical protein FWC42_10485 [Proteobacteria bacterium]|nr:hypothetical protein [Pseudomonadota bacterium]
MVRGVAIRILGIFLSVGAAVFAQAQECPREDQEAYHPSAVRSLEGKLIFHDSIRKWFELKLDEPQCGQRSIQLARWDDEAPLQVLRGCRVRSKGIIALSLTNYYSLDLYQAVDEIEAVGPCKRQPLFVDNSTAKPDSAIRKYRVEMSVDSRPGDHPLIFRVRSASKELRPWQAYASYELTGCYVLYASCGEGFVVDRVYGSARTGASNEYDREEPGRAVFNGEYLFDPAVTSGRRKPRMGYTCIRAE